MFDILFEQNVDNTEEIPLNISSISKSDTNIIAHLVIKLFCEDIAESINVFDANALYTEVIEVIPPNMTIANNGSIAHLPWLIIHFIFDIEFFNLCSSLSKIYVY